MSILIEVYVLVCNHYGGSYLVHYLLYELDLEIVRTYVNDR